MNGGIPGPGRQWWGEGDFPIAVCPSPEPENRQWRGRQARAEHLAAPQFPPLPTAHWVHPLHLQPSPLASSMQTGKARSLGQGCLERARGPHMLLPEGAFCVQVWARTSGNENMGRTAPSQALLCSETFHGFSVPTGWSWSASVCPLARLSRSGLKGPLCIDGERTLARV